MAHRSLEETISTIAPSREAGIPNPPTLAVGVSSDDGDLSSALSQAGQQIEQLQSAYQQQASLIQANTQALQSNTSSHSSSGGGTLGSIASSLFGGALGFLSPIVSGIASLFGSSSAPTPLPVYTPPPPVSINGVVQSPGASTSPVQTPQDAAPASTLSSAGEEVAQLQAAYRAPSVQAQPAALELNTRSIENDTAHAESASAPDSDDSALGYLSQIAAAIANPSGNAAANGSSQTTTANVINSSVASAIDSVLNGNSQAGANNVLDQFNTTSSNTNIVGGSVASAISNVLASDGPAPSIANVLGASGTGATPLPVYTPPAPVPLSAAPQPPSSSSTPAANQPGTAAAPGAGGNSTSATQQITVNISAMDSQSFMDRSDDIASAVRSAMLNMHPINDVVANL